MLYDCHRSHLRGCLRGLNGGGRWRSRRHTGAERLVVIALSLAGLAGGLAPEPRRGSCSGARRLMEQEMRLRLVARERFRARPRCRRPRSEGGVPDKGWDFHQRSHAWSVLTVALLVVVLLLAALAVTARCGGGGRRRGGWCSGTSSRASARRPRAGSTSSSERCRSTSQTLRARRRAASRLRARAISFPHRDRIDRLIPPRRRDSAPAATRARRNKLPRPMSSRTPAVVSAGPVAACGSRGLRRNDMTTAMFRLSRRDLPRLDQRDRWRRRASANRPAEYSRVTGTGAASIRVAARRRVPGEATEGDAAFGAPR